MDKIDYDLCIIGGGINGAGIARDAAGRGLSVLLVEAQDLAGATSSASTKLIHGGLRYLEYYEFGLVRHALREREVLMNLAPHIIWPLDFVLPHDKNLRPAWMIRAGLWLYDHLAGRQQTLPRSRALDLAAHEYGAPLKDDYKKGFCYADCWVDDARLVVLNAMDAARHGATILTRVACTALTPQKDDQDHNDYWKIALEDTVTQRRHTVTARQVVNAAGPWVRALLEHSGLTHDDTPDIRLVKGSHIIVPRQFDGPQCYILQQPDKRVVFAIPYEEHFTLIGTTEIDYHGDPSVPALDEAETAYLLAAVNRSFKAQLSESDIISSYSGVRPLFDDHKQSAAAVTRDYRLVHDTSFGPALLSVFGGKITTYRLLAQEAVDSLTEGKAGADQHWTGNKPLPGGDIPGGDRQTFIAAQQERYPWLPPALAERYASHYGTLMDVMLAGAAGMNDMGLHYGDGIYEKELHYLTTHEWAKTVDDILWRRSKLGLHVSEKTIYNLGATSLLQTRAPHVA